MGKLGLVCIMYLLDHSEMVHYMPYIYDFMENIHPSVNGFKLFLMENTNMAIYL